MSSNKKMQRGVQQALYKYLPGSWVDFTTSGGGVTYAVHVDNWNSVHLVGINNKRLLRVINQRVQEFISNSPDGPASVVDFAQTINEDTYDVLTPKISDQIGAIQTSVKPWVFICNSCGRVRQYYTYDEFKSKEHKPCDVCGKHMTQLRMIRFCKCGYADGIFVPKCSTPDHGTKYMTRRGSGLDFVCRKCGKKAALPFYCPECHQKLDIKPALDSSHYMPFTLSLIDLLDKRKDLFLEKEENSRGERVVISQYLSLISKEQYDSIISNGKISDQSDYDAALEKEAAVLREQGLDESIISMVLDAKRRGNPNSKVFEAIEKVASMLAIPSNEELKLLAEEILEYDELLDAKVKLSIKEAENDAEIVNDGIKPDYESVVKKAGFGFVQMCSGVPIITSAYGYTRKERFGQGVKLHGFPQEMEKKNVYAAKLETEGVIFELDRKKVIDWLLKNDFITDMDLPTDFSDLKLKAWFLEKIRTKLITSFTAIEETDVNSSITKHVYTLLHSISHALINEVAEICGLDKSSISEYILPNIPAVFIYCSNSQGYNMGALYSAFQTHFDRWINHAMKNSKSCIFDPVCINREKACAGCLFLNEVSCQHFNKDLDRSYLCGYYDIQAKKKLHGYWEE